jgi:hypothetical protein
MRIAWIAGAAGSVLLCLASATAQAGPTGNASAVRVAANEASIVDKVASRCWWRGGRRYCARWRGPPRVYGYGYYYGRPRPEAFPTGSSAWWRAMDYEGRGGHGRTR